MAWPKVRRITGTSQRLHQSNTMVKLAFYGSIRIWRGFADSIWSAQPVSVKGANVADKKTSIDIKKGYPPPRTPPKPKREDAGYTPPKPPKKPHPQPPDNRPQDLFILTD